MEDRRESRAILPEGVKFRVVVVAVLSDGRLGGCWEAMVGNRIRDGAVGILFVKGLDDDRNRLSAEQRQVTQSNGKGTPLM